MENVLIDNIKQESSMRQLLINLKFKILVNVPSSIQFGNSLFSNRLLNLELLNIVLSFDEPGHRATTSNSLRSELQVA